MKINEWQPWNYIQRKTVHLQKQYPCRLINETRSKKLKEKLNLSFISANKHSFLSTREVKMAVYSPRNDFFRVTMDRDKVEVHKKRQ